MAEAQRDVGWPLVLLPARWDRGRRIHRDHSPGCLSGMRSHVRAGQPPFSCESEWHPEAWCATARPPLSVTRRVPGSARSSPRAPAPPPSPAGLGARRRLACLFLQEPKERPKPRKMPGKLKVKIVAGRHLPVMDRASDLTDAFVEVGARS